MLECVESSVILFRFWRKWQRKPGLWKFHRVVSCHEPTKFQKFCLTKWQCWTCRTVRVKVEFTLTSPAYSRVLHPAHFAKFGHLKSSSDQEDAGICGVFIGTLAHGEVKWYCQRGFQCYSCLWRCAHKLWFGQSYPPRVKFPPPQVTCPYVRLTALETDWGRFCDDVLTKL